MGFLPAHARVTGTRVADAGHGAVRELRDALTRWLHSPRGAEYQPAIKRLAAGWLELVAGEPGWDTRSVDLLGDLAAEVGLLMRPGRTVADDRAGSDGAGRPDDSALLAFSDDPATPPGLAGRARDWRARVRYGLWRVDEGEPGPGLVCTDILSGRVRYVEFPPEVRAGLVRWAVWYGGIVPVDGTWRSTGLGTRLSPAEADAAAELILAETAHAEPEQWALAQPVPGQRVLAQPVHGQPLRFGVAEPRGVAIDYETAPPDRAALTVSRMAGAAIGRVLGEVYRYRATPPAPVNSSDEPVSLITAWFTVPSPERFRTRLLERDDFRSDPVDPSLICWSESAMAGTSRASLGSSCASLGTLRIGPADTPGGADTANPARTTVVAHVNSAARFAYLQALLAKLGPELTACHEKHVDPVLHTAWPQQPPALFPVPVRDWERYWLGRPLAVLGNQTPRQAAGTGYLPELITLIRQFEYQAGVLALEGKSGADTALIRRELGLTSLD
jgi:hypothetical protein